MSDPKRKIAETLADERKPRSGTLFGMAKPMSDQERALREKIAAGGETIYAPTRRAPLEGVLNMDPFEMVTGMPFSDGNEDYGALTQMATSGVSNYATPAYLQPGYEGPQTGLGPVGDALAGLGQVFQGGNVAGPMGGPSNVLSQYAGRLPAADRAFGTAGGVKVPGRGLGKGLGDLMADEAGAARPTLDAAPEGITAYHGSPHTFDRFDMSKIGSGEGAQAYGHGLYFAENEKVARDYRQKLAPTDGSMAKPDMQAVQDYGAQWDALVQKRRALTASDGRPMPGADAIDDQMDALHAQMVADSIKRTPSLAGGSMYQVRLNVKPDELLDWDRPLSEQPEGVRKALRDLKPDATGGQVYESSKLVPGDFADKKGAADALKARGIKGIRYLDQGSRPIDDAFGPAAQAQAKASLAKAIESGDTQQAAHLRKVIRNMEEGAARQKTYNYVIFDDKLVTILKRYGIPVTLGTGGAAIVSGQDMPPEVAAQLGPQG